MLKKLATFALVVAIGVLLCAIPILFINGAVWASEHLLHPLIRIGWWALAITVVALPLAVIKPMRAAVATAILLSSFVYGVIAWLVGFIITYTYWGVFGALFGLFMGGVGIVPFGFLASAFHGWNGFASLLVLVVLTIGSRVVAHSLAASADNYYAARA